MRRWLWLSFKAAGAALLLVVAAGLIAPSVTADRYAPSIQSSLERALGRSVEIGKVRFNVFKGPGFELEKVVIHEDPSFGIEPIARVEALEVVPRLLPLLTGHLVVASIRLDDAGLNLTKTGAAADPGRWNFEPLINRRVIAAFPEVHVRNGRINFKFGDTKSSFYLMNADLDIRPPASGPTWSIKGSAEPARTDRPAQGLGSFEANGSWTFGAAGDRMKLDVLLERTGLGEIAALLGGENTGVHGTVSSRLHLEGPLHEIRITGRLNVEDVHRWDLLPPKGEGWPLDVRGRLNLLASQLELESNSAGNVQLPLFLRFRVSDFLAQPHWGLSVNWNRFPVAPLMELARHMGAQFPEKLRLTGTIDGALGYSGAGSLQGQLAFHETALTVPDSPPVRFDQATVLFGQGHVYLKPAVVLVTDEEQAEVEADYASAAQTLDLNISTEGMDVASLRRQVALAAVPWLEQVQKGTWSGQLHYHFAPSQPGAAASGWTGKLEVADAVIAVPGLADPVQIVSARAQIDRARVVLDRIRARVGKSVVTGEYRYEPQVTRPHRVRLIADEVDAADLEKQMIPTLRRTPGLLARALGRAAPVPDWLRQRNLEGSLQMGSLLLAGERFDNVRTHVVWDVTRLDLSSVQAKLGNGSVAGKVSINLRGARPAYKITGTLKGLGWQGGKLDAEAEVETAGFGADLLTGTTATGTFHGADVEIGATQWDSVAGGWQLAWSRGGARLRFTDLLFSGDDEVYKGSGATADDGRLVIMLTNGAREMRVSGTLAQLKVE